MGDMHVWETSMDLSMVRAGRNFPPLLVQSRGRDRAKTLLPSTWHSGLHIEGPHGTCAVRGGKGRTRWKGNSTGDEYCRYLTASISLEQKGSWWCWSPGPPASCPCSPGPGPTSVDSHPPFSCPLPCILSLLYEILIPINTLLPFNLHLSMTL